MNSAPVLSQGRTSFGNLRAWFRGLIPVLFLLGGCASSIGEDPAPNSAATVPAVPTTETTPAVVPASPTETPFTGDSTPPPTASPSPVASPTASPTPAGPQYTYSSVATTQPFVAITFDDGPHATNTPRLLKMLRDRNIKATFFMVGQCVEEYPDLTRQILAEGHELANHSWSHPAYTRLSTAAAQSQTLRTQNAIEKATGVRPTLFRPPYGATNAAIKKWTHDTFGMKTILWTVDPLDWKRPGASVVAQRIVSGAHPGAIILAHDIHGPTIDAMPATLDGLLARGYKFLTVSELIDLEGKPAPQP